MFFRQLFDRETCTYSYILADPNTKEAIVVDPVRELFDRDCLLIKEWDLKIKWVFETHIHADHITAASLYKKKFACKVGLGAESGISVADRLFKDEEILNLGDLQIRVLLTPGHTNGCTCYVVNNKFILTGDTLFIRGCGRTDFQQGSSQLLYKNVHEKIFKLDDEVLVYPGHDYNGRMVSTVGEEKRYNPRLGQGKTLMEFIAIMDSLNLPEPAKIKEAVPANLILGEI